jgi:hypothetical protein
MSDEEFEEDVPELDDDDVPEDDLEADDELVEQADDIDLLDDEIEVIPEGPVAVVTDDKPDPAPEEEDDEEGVVDLDEELHPDDVEEPLDVLLQERTASAAIDDEEEELEDEDADGDPSADGPARIVPRRPDEFLCQSCFLLLPLRRLADPKRQYCDDCA